MANDSANCYFAQPDLNPTTGGTILSNSAVRWLTSRAVAAPLLITLEAQVRQLFYWLPDRERSAGLALLPRRGATGGRRQRQLGRSAVASREHCLVLHLLSTSTGRQSISRRVEDSPPWRWRIFHSFAGRAVTGRSVGCHRPLSKAGCGRDFRTRVLLWVPRRGTHRDRLI
jgi:hypothetical protein